MAKRQREAGCRFANYCRTSAMFMWHTHACGRPSAIPQASRELALQRYELLRPHLEEGASPLRAIASEASIPIEQPSGGQVDTVSKVLLTSYLAHFCANDLAHQLQIAG